MTLKKIVSAVTLFAFGGILTSFAAAQSIPLTIDPTQSSVELSIGGVASSSQLSGDFSLNLQDSDPPSGNVQITDLNLVVDEELEFSFLLVSATAAPGSVTISMVTPGPAVTISGNTFDQLDNVLAINGELNVRDPLNLAGGSQTFDLSEIDPGSVDINSVSITQSGNVITISSNITINETVDIGLGDTPAVVDVTYVATGIVPEDPFLLGDVDLSGAVDFLDIGPFIALLSEGGFQDEADIDQSSVVDFLDIGPFIAILSGR